MFLGQTGFAGEIVNAQAPLVLAAAQRRYAMKKDFTLPQREVAVFEVNQATARKTLEETGIAGERGEQPERRHPGARQSIEHGLNFGNKRRSRRFDSLIH